MPLSTIHAIMVSFRIQDYQMIILNTKLIIPIGTSYILLRRGGLRPGGVQFDTGILKILSSSSVPI